MDDISENADHQADRAKMVECVQRHFVETAKTTGVKRIGDHTKAAMLRVPRHRFVPSGVMRMSYADSALSIGWGQTISQPFIVALMIELASVTRESRVLEIGTGSGYQAAVLSMMAAEVYSVECVPELADRSAACLKELGLDGVHLRSGDGFDGWPEAAPFDAILVAACSKDVPEPLVRQLAEGGRMVIPIGLPNAYQELQVIEKVRDGEIRLRHSLPVAFVPLVHAEERGVAKGS